MYLRPLLLSAVFLVISAVYAMAAPVHGYWLTHKSKGMIRISPCGPGLCGQVVWLRQPLNKAGQPVRDIKNRDARLRGRPVMGLTTFSGLAPVAPNQWSGTFYNPEDGRIYRGSITLVSQSQIKVQACRINSGTCGSRNWKRAQQRAQN